MASSSVKSIEDRSLFGILLVLVSIFLFTGIDTCAKWLVLAGMPQPVVVFIRFAIHFAFVFVIITPSHGLDLFRTRNLPLEIARGMTLLIATIVNFIAIQYLPLTVTGAIIFSMPLFLTAVSGPLLGERVGWRRWAAVTVGFLGVLIIIRPFDATVHWAAVLLLLTPISFAFYSVASRKLAGVDSAYTQQVYAALLPALCILPFAAADWAWPSSASTWFAFAAIGIFAGAGHLFLTIAHRFAPASTLAPFLYPQIILMSISSWVFFDQPPDMAVFVGAIIVAGSGLYIWLREHKLQQQPNLVNGQDESAIHEREESRI